MGNFVQNPDEDKLSINVNWISLDSLNVKGKTTYKNMSTIYHKGKMP